MLYWFWFTGIKNNKEIREKIPFESWENAEKELVSMGYSNLKMIDSYPFRDYKNTYAASY